MRTWDRIPVITGARWVLGLGTNPRLRSVATYYLPLTNGFELRTHKSAIDFMGNWLCSSSIADEGSLVREIYSSEITYLPRAIKRTTGVAAAAIPPIGIAIIGASWIFSVSWRTQRESMRLCLPVPTQKKLSDFVTLNCPWWPNRSNKTQHQCRRRE